MPDGRNSGILVYIERENSKIAAVSLELLEKARLLTSQENNIYAVYIGSDIEAVKQEIRGYPLAKLYCYETQQAFQADTYEAALADCIDQLKPAIVLIGGTIVGRSLAPRIAVTFKTGLTADCTQLELDLAGHLVQIRPAFGGNIMASILTPQSRPQIATVRPGIFTKARRQKDLKEPEIIQQRLRLQERGSCLLAITDQRKLDGIEKQDVLVAAGRGIKSKEDLEMLRELARLLGARLASSRALVEKGWMKPSEQIGLSGTTVRPKCLLTFGISGTVQFITGMKNSANIIAVNTDSSANIFNVAHVPICADLYEVVPEMIRLLKQKERVEEE